MKRRHPSPRKPIHLWLALALILWALAALAQPARAADPAQGPGGPILVVTSGQSTYGTY